MNRTVDLTEILSTEWSAMRPPEILGQLTDEERALVFSLARVREVRKDDILFRQGDPHHGIFVIQKGIIRTFFIAPSGREMTLAYWQPGNYVGGPDMFSASFNMWSGIAIEDTEILALGGENLRKLVADVPTLAINLIDAQAFKGRWFSAVIQMLGTRSVTGRLAQLLLTLSEYHGVQTGEGLLISGGFTHDDLAQMVGASRQWVTTTLDRFEREGMIRISRRKILVLDSDLLMGILTD